MWSTDPRDQGRFGCQLVTNPAASSLNQQTRPYRRALWCAALVSSLAIAGTTSPAAAALVRQPYLQKATSTSMAIVWRTTLSSPSDSRVQ